MNPSGDSMFSKKISSLVSYIRGSTFKSIHDMCDVTSVVVFCSSDNTIMLVIESSTSEYWIPSVRVPGGNSWLNYIAKDLLQDIFGKNPPLIKLLRLNKLWMPASQKAAYITHSVFEVQVSLELKKKSKNPFGKYKGKIRWSTLDEVLKFHSNSLLKSPEIIDYFYSVSNNKDAPVRNLPPEYVSAGNFTEINESVLISNKISIYDLIVEASGMDRSCQEILYREFLLVCFPCLYITFQAFSKFVIDMGWPKDDVPNLYYSADIYNRGGISFRELLYFIAATEPGTVHGGSPAELRCRYIFKYLDYDRNNLLKRDELKNFVILVRKSRKLPLDAVKVEKELSSCYQAIGIPETHPLTMSEFLRAVGELKIRGTSQIFRAPNSIQKYVRELIDRDAKVTAQSDQPMQRAPFVKMDGYEVGAHTVKIKKSGTALNIEQFWTIENATSVTSMAQSTQNNYDSRRISIDKFDQNSKSNELLKVLRYLPEIHKFLQPYIKIDSFNYNWGQLDPAVVAKHVVAVCDDVKDILKKEERLLKISSPVYIMGDIHGNYHNLLYFEKILWHVGPGLCPCNLLFLGDYVDRGLYSLEVCCYLLAYKLQSPRKVFLLRGNHEIKRVQMQWTFEKECKHKFGDKLGSTVFDCINNVFDVLPLAAVIDGRVFCCHGGIPPPWLCPVVTAINDIPAVLSDPQDQSTLAWDLMWNDPLRSKHMTDKLGMELLANEGFAANTRRGTAHVFSVEALEKFLAANDFTHLVRAHEVVEAGFYLQQKGKLLTIFSSAKYCGGQNVAACILADQGRLRVMRLETE